MVSDSGIPPFCLWCGRLQNICSCWAFCVKVISSTSSTQKLALVWIFGLTTDCTYPHDLRIHFRFVRKLATETCCSLEKVSGTSRQPLILLCFCPLWFLEVSGAKGELLVGVFVAVWTGASLEDAEHAAALAAALSAGTHYNVD